MDTFEQEPLPLNPLSESATNGIEASNSSLEILNLEQVLLNNFKQNLEYVASLLNSQVLNTVTHPDAMAEIAKYWEKLVIDLKICITPEEYTHTLLNLPERYMQFSPGTQVFVVDLQNGQIYYRQDSILIKRGPEVKLVELSLNNEVMHMTAQIIGDLLANIAMVKTLDDYFKSLPEPRRVFTTGQTINQTKFSMLQLKDMIPIVGSKIGLKERRVQDYLPQLTPAIQKLLVSVGLEVYQGDWPGSFNLIYLWIGLLANLSKSVVNMDNFFVDDPLAGISVYKGEYIEILQQMLAKQLIEIAMSTANLPPIMYLPTDEV